MKGEANTREPSLYVFAYILALLFMDSFAISDA
jgi:hypothetical protein